MSLPKKLAAKKAVILKSWIEMVINTYPAETARFLTSGKDPFANPVGHATRQSLEILFDLLLDPEIDRNRAGAALDPVIRIRAIQDFSPTQATRFVFDLKNVMRDSLSLDFTDPHTLDEFIKLEQRIDAIGFLAFDIYVQCREKIYAIKANELRDRTFKAFARAGLVKEPLEDI